MKQMLGVVSLCLICSSVIAAEPVRSGFWGSIDLGFGSLNLRPEAASDSTNTRLYLAFQGGYTLTPQFQLGVEAGGWNIEATEYWGNPAKGEGLMQLFAVMRYWPDADSKLFIKLGGGSVTHWNNDHGAGKGSGSGYCLGLGYELARFGAMETYWFLNYNAGAVSGYTPPAGVRQDEHYTAWTAGLGMGF